MKKIGVVIPACNEEAYIERCLLALKSAQTYFLRHLKFPNFLAKDPSPKNRRELFVIFSVKAQGKTG